MSEAEKTQRIRSEAIDALAEVDAKLGAESAKLIMDHLREIVRLCDDVR